MVQNLYSHSLLTAWVMLFIFSVCLFCARSEKRKPGKVYILAKDILGAALLIFGVEILLQWIYDFRGTAPQIATALNISTFYLEAILFGMAFISLINPTYICRRQLRNDFAKWALTSAILWAATLWLEGTTQRLIQGAASLIFLLDAGRITILFFKTYHKAVKEMDNYYADNVSAFVRWLYRSTIGIVFFGLTVAVVAFAPKWVVAIQMTAGILMFAYIFLSFMNYMLNFELVEKAVKKETLPADDVNAVIEEASSIHATAEPEEETTATGTIQIDLIKDDSGTEPENGKQSNTPTAKGSKQKKRVQAVAPSEMTVVDTKLRKQIEKWIRNHEYRKNGITIEQAASELGTNRTYLSACISTWYGCAFREWINTLRIDDAKHLILKHKDMQIDAVAREMGFATCSHFCRVFNDKIGQSPSQWRKNNTDRA